MIAEIVSNGTLSLPNAMAAVGIYYQQLEVHSYSPRFSPLSVIIGIVPALIVTLFLGIFALYTSKLLIDFKLRHPQVHSMGALRALHTAIVASELTCPIR